MLCMLSLAEVISTASLLKISSMQCNTWCAELLFQKVKNYLGLTEEEHDLYWLICKV